MHSTFFAGLTELDPWEPISTDGSAIQSRNPSITDHFLKIGAVTHRHDAHAALGDPTVAPSAAVVSSGGAIPAGLTIEVGVTVTDPDGGETILSPTVSVTTGGGLAAPDSAPAVEADYTGGTLRIDTYFYGITLLDAGGGETSLGPMAQVTREPGHASGQVQISGLFDLIDGTEAVAWKLYRATGGNDWAYIASGVEDTFTDTGGICADCSAQPPREGTNTTGQTSILQVTLPPVPSGAVDYEVYATLDGSFSTPALLATYPVASAGATVEYVTLDFLDGRPPTVSTCVGGANRIDALSELVNLPSALTALGYASGGGGGGGGSLVNPLGTEIVWTDTNASAAVKVIGDVRVDEATGYQSSFYDDPDGTPTDPATAGNSYYMASGGVMMPSGASHNNLDTTTYWSGFAQFSGVGRITRGIDFLTSGWWRLGVGFGGGTPGQGVVAWVRNDAPTPKLQLAYRIDGSGGGNNDAGWVIFAEADLPGAVPDDSYYTLTIVVAPGNMITAFLQDGKTTIAQIEATELPDPAKPTYGIGGSNSKFLMTADRWTSDDSFYFDDIAMFNQTYHNELKARVYNEAGSYYERILLDDLGHGVVDLTLAWNGGNAIGTDWEGDAGSNFPQTWRDMEDTIHFQGRLKKTSGSAPAIGDVLVNLGDSLGNLPSPTHDRYFPVLTGDDDGEELGWVKVDYFNGVISWQGGRSTDPATKSPWVALDPVSYF